jgi:hypothetical protein
MPALFFFSSALELPGTDSEVLSTLLVLYPFSGGMREASAGGIIVSVERDGLLLGSGSERRR